MNPYILSAKSAVENYVKEKKIISPAENLPEEFLNKRAGTFVTIEKQGQLRGCIGTYLPTRENIAQEIIHNAIAAAIKDYRFGPIRKQELPHLSYTVYILENPELVLTKEVSDPSKPSSFWRKGWARRARLNPQKYGIIVKTIPISYPRPIGSASPPKQGERGSPEAANGADVVFNGHLPSKTGFLLPDLKGINTVEEQVFIACQKGGIDPVKENMLIYRFAVEKYN